MITTTTDKEINLTQLDKELGSQGLCLNELEGNAKIVGIADASKLTLAQLNAGIANHNAVQPIITIEDKLASVGLSLAELKAALQ